MPCDVRDMLDLYGVGPEQRDALIQIARQKGWWHAYTDVPVVPGYIGLEVSAAAIDTFGALLVPGLLQTEDYAWEVLGARPRDIERRLQLRVARQALLSHEDAPRFWVVLDEGVLHRTVGGRRVMCEQLQSLIDATGLPNVTIQILPFGAGEHAGLDGQFTLISSADRADSDVIYLEDIASDSSIEDDATTSRHAAIFDHLRGVEMST